VRSKEEIATMFAPEQTAAAYERLFAEIGAADVKM